MLEIKFPIKQEEIPEQIKKFSDETIRLQYELKQVNSAIDLLRNNCVHKIEKEVCKFCGTTFYSD